jgi:hypothetical protein
MTLRSLAAVLFLVAGAIGLIRGAFTGSLLLLIMSCAALACGMLLAIAPRAGSLVGIVLSFVQSHQMAVVVLAGFLLVGLLWHIWQKRHD